MIKKPKFKKISNKDSKILLNHDTLTQKSHLKLTYMTKLKSSHLKNSIYNKKTFMIRSLTK